MEAFHLACLLLSICTDGAPTYMRMTDSTSLESVYACILENSRNVDSVIMATQTRGLILDVGQVEENVSESIRSLPGRTGQSLRMPEEDVKMLKALVARFLTVDHRDSRNDAGSSNFQRSIDRSQDGGQPRTYPE